jgi:hypothetical protein
MSTYIASLLGCLTAMALVAYGKELRGRWYRREPLFRKGRNDYYDNW